MPRASVLPTQSMTQSPVGDLDEHPLGYLYLNRACSGTDPSTCIYDPIHIVEGYGGTVGLPSGITFLAAGPHLASPEIWYNIVPRARGYQGILMAVSGGTASNAFRSSYVEPFHHLASPGRLPNTRERRPETLEMVDPGLQRSSGGVQPVLGASAKISQELVEILGMTPGEIAKMLNISDRGFRNWLTGARMRLPNEKRVLWLKHLASLVKSRLGRESVRTWFITPIDGIRTPYDLIHKGELGTVAALASVQFEKKPEPRELDAERVGKLGFPFNVLDADDEELNDLSRVLDEK